MADAPRDEKGRLLPGNNLRGKARHRKAKVISRKLRKEYVRRYANEPTGADGEVLGEERAVLKHYFVAMDIMEDTKEAAKDRLKAAELLANRMDGKPVDEVELSATLETNSPLEKAVSTMTPEQLLELVRAARGH